MLILILIKDGRKRSSMEVRIGIVHSWVEYMLLAQDRLLLWDQPQWIMAQQGSLGMDP